MRCPDCNKFVSQDLAEIEVDSADGQIDEGAFAIPVRLVLCCAECSSELAEANVDAEFEIPDYVTEDWEIEIEGETTERYQSTDLRTGKPINPRYQKHFYGADLTLTAKPPEGDTEHEEVSAITSVEEQASSFDPLN